MDNEILTPQVLALNNDAKPALTKELETLEGKSSVSKYSHYPHMSYIGPKVTM